MYFKNHRILSQPHPPHFPSLPRTPSLHEVYMYMYVTEMEFLPPKFDLQKVSLKKFQLSGFPSPYSVRENLSTSDLYTYLHVRSNDANWPT